MASVTFRYANDRPPVALIAAAQGVNQGQIITIRRAMEMQGWQAVPALADGKNILQVSGFKDEGQLAALLLTQHFASGKPRITPEPGDHPTLSVNEWLEDNSIRAGGVLNLIGDGGLMVSGLMAGRSQEAVAGMLYTGGALVSARYGNVRTEYHVRQVQAELAEYLKEQAGTLPEDCGLYSILRDYRSGGIQRAEDFLYRYPSQTMLGAYTLGALSMLQSGLRHGKPWDVAYGVNSVASKVGSLLIPEKPKDEPSKGGLIGWLQEKPLRLFGYGSLISDVLLGMSALHEYRFNPKQKSYIFKFLTTGTYIMSDLMFAISNKNAANAGGKFDVTEQRSIEALAAETIARQPKAMQSPLANQVAGFLSLRPEINGTAQEIAASIIAQAQAVEQNPWTCRVTDFKGQIPNVNQVSI